MTNRRDFIQSTGAVLATAMLPGLAGAATAKFPTRPIKYICPWPAGGATDLIMRSLAESASKILGQNVVIENKPGAGGTLGATEVVTDRPDGYTIAQVPQGVFRIPHMQKVNYDTLHDFTWIICLTGYIIKLIIFYNFLPSTILIIQTNGLVKMLKCLCG